MASVEDGLDCAGVQTARSHRVTELITRLQASLRGWLQRRAYKRKQAAAIVVQVCPRSPPLFAVESSKGFHDMALQASMIPVESSPHFNPNRCCITLRTLTCANITVLQAAWRGHMGRQRAEAVRQQRAAVIIQKNWRRTSAVKAYKHAILCAPHPDWSFSSTCTL